MTLAEALLIRSDMQKKLVSLRERIAQSAIVQQGETPHEDPAKLLKEAVGVLNELEALTIRIDAANLQSKLPDGRTIASAVAHRAMLMQHHSLLAASIAATRKEPDRYSMSEIKWVATLPVAKLQAQSEDLARQIRELNALIQKTNWSIELK